MKLQIQGRYLNQYLVREGALEHQASLNNGLGLVNLVTRITNYLPKFTQITIIIRENPSHQNRPTQITFENHPHHPHQIAVRLKATPGKSPGAVESHLGKAISDKSPYEEVKFRRLGNSRTDGGPSALA
jgi:hypothetical protein